MKSKKMKPVYKADGGNLAPKGTGGMHRAMGLPKTPMPAMPRMKPAAPAAPRSRMAMMSNGGKAKKGC